MNKLKTGIALAAIVVATCLQVPAVYAEDIQPPRTSGEGDQIIQDIAEELTGSSGGSGYSGAMGSRQNNNEQSPIVLAPVTGGVIQPNRNAASAPATVAPQSATARNDDSGTVLAVSALVAGSLMIGATMVLESQRRQRRRHHRSH